MNDKPNMLKAALAYAEKGYEIFPCSGKRPLTRNGFKDASSDPDQIRKWWKKWPNANIGMPTTGRVVIDFDKGKGGEDSRTDLETEYEELPLTLTHRTGGGGLHYIYDNPTGEKVTSVNGLREGVDRKADGGYIIMPPSLHKSGKRYKALNKEEIAPAPEWLMKLESTQKGKFDTPIEEGGRQNEYTRLAGSMRAAGASEDDIYIGLKVKNERPGQDPLPDKELRSIAKSVAQYESDITLPPPLINLEDIETREVEYLWYPYIPLGKLTLIDGDPGECKSWLALAVAAKVSVGEYGRGPANVIVASLEDDEDDCMKPRLEDLGADMKRIKSIDKNFPFMLNEKGLRMLEDYIKETYAEFVILDPILGYMAEADMHRANEMRAITSQLRRIASENSCAIVGIRHMTKPGKGLSTKAIYRGLGSIDLIAAARSGLLVGHIEDEDGVMTERGMTHIKSNYAPLGDPVGFEIVNYGRHGLFSWNITCAITSKGILGIRKKESKIDEAREWLKDKLADGEPIPSIKIVEAGELVGISERTMRAAKSKLEIESIRKGGVRCWVL